jgi:AcrR family transcriptional regulator
VSLDDLPDPEHPVMSLSQLVARTGVPASTIHHYRRSGWIPQPTRQANRHFGYDEAHVEAILELRSGSSTFSHDCRARLIAAAIEAFRTRSFAEVSVSDITSAAQMAKGNFYRYFPSKEALITACIETLVDDTASRLEAALESTGGVEPLRADPDKAALVLGYVLADVLPLLLELGARAAKGHEPSADLARRSLRTLASVAGRPFLEHDVEDDAKLIDTGLEVLQSAFATVMSWAVGPDWPPDEGSSSQA